MQKNLLSDWLVHIESFHPREIELGLERVSAVAEKMSLLRLPGIKILIAGTNGKGSCVAAIEALALECNLTVVSYTSPHLVSFNERIRINGREVDDLELVEAFNKVEQTRGDTELTFFEFTTLAALEIIRRQQPDLALLEVGLGGRQDATNIIEPDLSLITTVDYDHADWLGDSLEQIAYEKGGIMRKGKPAFIGDEKTFRLLSKACPDFTGEMTLVSESESESESEQALEWQAIVSDSIANPLQLLPQNLLLAIRALEHGFELKLAPSLVTRAFSQITLLGRFQRLSLKHECLLDVAHNPQSAFNLATQLKAYLDKNDFSRVVAICGMMSDKAVDEVLRAMTILVDCWHFTDLPLARAMDAKELSICCRRIKPDARVDCFQSVADAFEAVQGDSDDKVLVLVFGSFVTVGAMLEYVQRCYSVEG